MQTLSMYIVDKKHGRFICYYWPTGLNTGLKQQFIASDLNTLTNMCHNYLREHQLNYIIDFKPLAQSILLHQFTLNELFICDSCISYKPAHNYVFAFAGANIIHCSAALPRERRHSACFHRLVYHQYTCRPYHMHFGIRIVY